jgi:hypothetical protein
MRNRVYLPEYEGRQFGHINTTLNSVNDCVFLDVWVFTAWSVAIKHPLACLISSLNLYKTIARWSAEVTFGVCHKVRKLFENLPK